MNIYLLKCEYQGGSTYDGFVVAASSEAEARQLAQVKCGHDEYKEWITPTVKLKDGNFGGPSFPPAPEESTCELIGTTKKKPGVILGSFNAE